MKSIYLLTTNVLTNLKKILFIVPYPYQKAPSQRFRFEQYEDFLKKNGFSVTYAPFLDNQAWEIFYKEGKVIRKAIHIFRSFLNRFLLLFQLKKYDYLFIHREITPLGPPIFEFIIRKILRRKFIYDFDDAIWLPNFSHANSSFEWMKMYKKTNKIMKWATLVSAGNEYLARHASQFNQNVQIIPTTIDTENYHNILCDHSKTPIVIGWTGSHSTMRYLDFIVPILQRLEKKYTFIFRVISDVRPNLPIRSLEFVPWKKATEINDLSCIQIGVMPLTPDQWSEGKCGFKGLQYMALGIVSVMSPVGVNNQIIENGTNGFLADSPEEWFNILSNLLEDTEKRKQIGKSGRQRIETAYSVLSQQKKYTELFSQLDKK